MTSLSDDYSVLRRNVLVPLAERLERHIKGICAGLDRVDRITARAKAVDRFLEKAAKIDENGGPKYLDPLRQIQDQIGARVVVYYLSDVAPASAIIEKYLRPIEAKDIVPDSEKEFGYFGKHFILLMPSDVYDDAVPLGTGPEFFELQIKTLFQHAWSEAEHDLGYKPSTRLTTEQRRRIAFTAAQAWGADLIFDELHRGIEAAE